MSVRRVVWSVVWVLAAGCSKDEAEEQARKLREEGELRVRQAGDSLDDQRRRLAEWQPALVEAAKTVKDDLAKIRPHDSGCEVVVATPEEGEQKLHEHRTQLEKLDRVEIDGLVVGYEQRQELTLAGVTYVRHFRATWVVGGRIVAVSYYSKEKLDAVEFVAVLKRLVPATNKVLEKVRIVRGT